MGTLNLTSASAITITYNPVNHAYITTLSSMKISPRACFCAGEELESSGSSSVEKTVKINHRGHGEHRELWFLLCALCELCGLYTKNRSKMRLPTGEVHQHAYEK